MKVNDTLKLALERALALRPGDFADAVEQSWELPLRSRISPALEAEVASGTVPALRYQPAGTCRAIDSATVRT